MFRMLLLLIFHPHIFGIVALQIFCSFLSFWWVGVCFLTAEFWKFFLCSVCCCGCCLIAKLYPTFWDPVDCSPPGSSVHGILQAIILEWVAMSSSRGSPWPRDQTCISCGSCIGRQNLYHWATREALYILHTSPLLDTCFAKIFSQSVIRLFIFVIIPFSEQKFLILKMFNWSIFFLHVSCWKIHPQIQVI